MPISHTHRCVFVHIPKTGGTSIESVLDMFHDWKIENTDACFGKIQSPELLARQWPSHFLQHLSWFELCSLIPEAQRAGYVSFSWVRNPWEKMVSVYANTDCDLLEHARLCGLELSHLSFAEFVQATLDFPHVHLRPQHEFILTPDGHPAVDFIGRFENFAADFDRLSQQLGVSLALPHKNASSHLDYRRYYDDATRASIAQKYHADIAAFGYTF